LINRHGQRRQFGWPSIVVRPSGHLESRFHWTDRLCGAVGIILGNRRAGRRQRRFAAVTVKAHRAMSGRRKNHNFGHAESARQIICGQIRVCTSSSKNRRGVNWQAKAGASYVGQECAAGISGRRRRLRPSPLYSGSERGSFARCEVAFARCPRRIPARMRSVGPSSLITSRAPRPALVWSWLRCRVAVGRASGPAPRHRFRCAPNWCP